ncbi:MAG: hypothetical protein ACOCQD_03415 [archaeon]
MTEILITRKAVSIVFIAILLSIAGIFLGGLTGILLVVIGVAMLLGFIGGELVKIIFAEFGVFIGIISIIMISILFGYLSSLLFGFIVGMFIAIVIPTVIIIYNARAKDFLRRP